MLSIFVVVLLVSSISKGFSPNASDYEYLLTLPINKKELRLAFYLFSLIFPFFLTTPLLLGWSIAVLGLPGVMVGLLLSLIILSLFSLRLRYKPILTLLLGLWALSPYFHFKFSFLSMFLHPNDYYSYVILTSLSLTLLILSYKTFDITNLGQSLNIPKRSEKGSLVDFSRTTPFKAVFLVSSLTFSPAYIIRTGRRYNLVLDVLASSIAALIIWVTNTSIILSPHIVNAIGSTMLLFYPLFIALGLSLSFISNSFSFEPIWLTFGLMEPATYARYYILGKSLYVFVLLLPLAIVYFLVPKGLADGILFLSMPFLYIVGVSLYAKVLRTQFLGIYEVGYRIEVKATAKQSLVSLFVFSYSFGLLLLGVIFYSIAIIEAYIVLSLILAGISIFLLRNKKYWVDVARKMAENGFI